MIRAWYEKIRDQKDSIYFAHHYGRFFGKNKNVFPSFHNSIEFAFGLGGELEIVISGKLHTLREGEICFMNTREPHRYYYNPGVECYIVLISQSFFTDVNHLGEISFPSHIEKCEAFDSIKQYLDYMIDRWDPDSLLCKRAFAETIAYLMTTHYPSFPKREMEKQSAVLLDAVKYICEHCTEKLTLGELAARFGYSVNYFSTSFNELMGTSFTDYLNICRIIEYYRIRKENPELSIGKVAGMCGFGSMNTFYRAQKKFERDGVLAADPAQREFMIPNFKKEKGK